MTLLDFGTLAIAIGAISGVIYSIWHNHHSARESLTEFKTEIKSEMSACKEALTSPEYGLMALNQKVSDFKVHCATMSTSLKERVIALEDEANKRRSRKRKS